MNTFHWKRATLALWIGGFTGTVLALDIGDSLDQAVTELGQPEGMIVINDTRIFYYERGRVEIHEGRVTSADLLSEEAYEALLLEEQRERLLREEELRERRARRHAEGLDALERKLADPTFFNASASRRLAYWRAFHRTYPEVSLPQDYVLALEERDAELRVEEAEARIRGLEQRVADAERRAYDTEQQAYVAYSSYAYPRYAAYPAVIVTGSSYGYGKPYRRGHYDPSHRKGDFVEHHGEVTRTHGGFVRGGATHSSAIHSRPFYSPSSTSVARSSPISLGITHVTAGH